MEYLIEKIDSGVATVRFADQSWAEVVLAENMTEQEVDDLVHQFAPKQGSVPGFLSVGQMRVAQAKPESEPVAEPEPEVPADAAHPWNQPSPEQPEWLQNRLAAYGTVQSQIEFITERGLDAWRAHVAEIKAMFPKTNAEAP